MRSLFKILSIVFIVIFSFSITVQAEEVVRFNLNDTASKNNRIFTITVSGDGDENISVGTFVFEYNADVIKFRDVNKINDTSKVKFKEEVGKLTVIFLDEKGVDLSKSAKLFTVDFKAENFTAPQEIALITADCVNKNVESFDSIGGKSTVSVIGKTSDDKEQSANSSETSQDKTESTEEKVSSSYDTENQQMIQSVVTDTNAENVQNSVLKIEAKDNTWSIFLSGAGLMLALVIIVTLAFYVGRKSK